MNRRPLTDQRLRRVSLWLALTIAWFAAHVLGRVAPQAATRLLRQHTRDARLLLIARAVTRTAFRAPRRGPIPVAARPYTCRRVAGAAFRRALRGRTPQARARALCAVLAAPDIWIAKIARRLRRGFTKLRALPKPGRAPAHAIASTHCAPLHAADTS